MKTTARLTLLAIAWIASSQPALASAVTIDLELDLTRYAYFGDFVPPPGGPMTQVWSSGLVDIPAVSAPPGETVRIDVRFAPGQSMTLVNGDWGRQHITVGTSPAPMCFGCGVETVLSEMSLLDGSLDVDLPLESPVTFLLGLPLATVFAPLTESSITFDGFTLLAVHSSDTYAAAFSEVSVLFQADQVRITTVPLPPAAGLMLIALSGLAVVRRRAAVTGSSRSP